MRCIVYRSLDKPSAFFGIRGRFTTWMVGLLGADLFVAFIVGAFFGTIFAFLGFVIGAVAAYMYIMGIQGKSSDRTFSMKMNSRKYRRYVRTPAGALRHIWKNDR